MASSPKVNKPTLYLIHGLRGSHEGFRFIADQLAENYHIISEDLPGSGAAPALDQPSLAAHIAYLHATISALPEKPILVAHSMGTIIATHYAEAYPDDTDPRLILISPILRPTTSNHLSKFLYGTLSAALAPLPSSTKKQVIASRAISRAISHYLTYDKSLQDHIDEEHYKYSGRIASGESFLADAKISMTATAILPKEKSTLIIMGAKDRLSDTKHVRTIANQASTPYHEIPETGHLLNYERPAEVAALISDFLA